MFSSLPVPQKCDSNAKHALFVILMCLSYKLINWYLETDLLTLPVCK